MKSKTTRTVRFDEGLNESLTRIATANGTSVNSIVNACVRKYVEWDLPTSGLGLIQISKEFLDRALQGLDSKEIGPLGRSTAKKFFVPAVELISGEMSVSAVIEIIRRTAIYSGRFKFSIAPSKDPHLSVLMMRHDSGQLWSTFYAAMADEVFNVMLRKKVQISTTDTMCLIRLELN